MALNDPRTPVRFEPTGQNDSAVLAELARDGVDPASEAGQERIKAARRAYLLKVPTALERINLHRALAARGARRYGPLAMLAALRDAVGRLYGETDTDARAEVIESIDAFAEGLRAYAARVRAGEYATDTDQGPAEQLAEVEALGAMDRALQPIADTVAGLDSVFANIRAGDQVYPEMFGLEATRIFLVGWENGPDGMTFGRDANGVRPEILDRLAADGQLAIIGAEVERLLSPTETQRKNSASLSATGSGPAASKDTSTAPATALSPATPSDSKSSTTGPNSESTQPTS